MVHGMLACVHENVFAMRSIGKCAICVYVFFYFNVSVCMDEGEVCEWVCLWECGCV